MKRLFFTLLLISSLLVSAHSVQAKYRKECIVRYATQNGWSKAYQVEVTFLTGFELNEATGRMSYSIYNVYAIIFWGEGKATVIKLKDTLVCGMNTNSTCINTVLGKLSGYDQDEDLWMICTSNICY